MGLALGELARRIGGILDGDPALRITSVAPLLDAGDGALSFLANTRYRKQLRATRASAVILAPEFAQECPTATITVPDPYVAYARAAQLLNPAGPARRGIHPAAVTGEHCRIDESAWIGPQCIVEDGAVIAAGVQLEGACFVGRNCRIGRDAVLGPRVTLCHATDIGERTIIHAGAVIGGDGFGQAYADGRWIRVPQLGRTRIGADVEIGANTTIDRGALGDTVIGEGVKIDDQVHIAHNVQVGRHTVIAGCTGISGSSRIGDHCRIGGGVGILGHLDIADNVTITAMSLVTRSIPKPGVYSSGMPVQENADWNRNVAGFRKLAGLVNRLRRTGKSADPDS